VGADGSDRDSEIWALAQAGQAHSEIAAKYGISRARVGQIVATRTPVEWGFTDAHRAAVRHQEAQVLKRLAAAAENVVNDPPPRSSAIGKVVTYPEGHAKAGEIVVDESVRVSAIRERRLISESYRRLTGTDLHATDKTEMGEAERRMRAAVAAERERRDEQERRLELLAATVPQPGDDEITEAELVPLTRSNRTSIPSSPDGRVL
jgi:hypothetical protein